MKVVAMSDLRVEKINRPNPEGAPARMFYGVVFAANQFSSKRSTELIWQRQRINPATKQIENYWLPGQSPEEAKAAIEANIEIKGRRVTRDARKGEILPYKFNNDKYALTYSCFVAEEEDEDAVFSQHQHPAPTTDKMTVIGIANALVSAGLAVVSRQASGESDQIAELQSLVSAPSKEKFAEALS